MEEALAAIRQAMTDEQAAETTLAPAEPRSSREQAGAKPIPETGLLSRQATAAVGSAFNIAKLPAHWEHPLDAPQGCRKRGGEIGLRVNAEQVADAEPHDLIRDQEENGGENDHHEHHHGGDGCLLTRWPSNLLRFGPHFLQELKWIDLRHRSSN